MELNGPTRFRPRKSTTSERFLGAFPHGPHENPSSSTTNTATTSNAAVELNEDDVFWTGSYSESDENQNQNHNQHHSTSPSTPRHHHHHHHHNSNNHQLNYQKSFAHKSPHSLQTITLVLFNHHLEKSSSPFFCSALANILIDSPIMYSTNSNVYQRYSQNIHETSQPAAFNVQSSTNPNSYDKYSHAPPSFDQEAASNGVPVSSTSQSSEASQPATPFLVQSKVRVPWSTGLCDCFSDYKNCCLTMWCPCITFGRITEIVDKGSSSCGAGGALYTLICCVVCCPCFYSCFYRSKMRQQYTLEKSPCGDCLVHCCCESCALCQEYRELESRGYDMKIGWHGNVERRNRGATMASTAPVVEGGMTR